MKKTLLAIGLMTTIGAAAQSNITFEDSVLAPNTYWSGSTGEGGFTFGNVFFENNYSTEFGGYWASGWIYSNRTDVTTAGYLNDASAYTGVGSGGSSNYAVSYGGNIDFGRAVIVEKLDITNTTYAALSMLNGDNFSKQFGSVNNANGQPDGTNGEDYFRVLIIGSDANSMPVDTVIFYLADYRFSDNTQDYIVDEWETVQLESMGAIRYLEFVMQSTDNNSMGILTPTYFAMDNLKFGTVGIEEHTVAAFTMYPNPASSDLTIKGQAGTLNVYSTTGALVYNGTTSGITSISLADWNSGFYVVELMNETGVTRSTLVKTK